MLPLTCILTVNVETSLHLSKLYLNSYHDNIFCPDVSPTAKVILRQGHSLKVSSNRLVKPGIQPATSGLQVEKFIFTTQQRLHCCIYSNALKTTFIMEANAPKGANPYQNASKGANPYQNSSKGANPYQNHWHSAHYAVYAHE